MKDYLNEAFKQLNILNEDTFSFDSEGAEDLKDFKEKESENDEISIIDIEAQEAEELKPSYVGKLILDCDVCHSKIFMDESEVVKDDETDLVNVEMECPYCHCEDGYTIIGKVCDAHCDDCDDEHKEDESEVEDEEDVEEITESIKGKKGKKFLKEKLQDESEVEIEDETDEHKIYKLTTLEVEIYNDNVIWIGHEGSSGITYPHIYNAQEIGKAVEEYVDNYVNWEPVEEGLLTGDINIGNGNSTNLDLGDVAGAAASLAPMLLASDAGEKKSLKNRRLKEDKGQKKLGLPKSVTISFDDIDEDAKNDEQILEDEVNDYLSDNYGYCVWDWYYEIKGNDIIITDINWDTSESLKEDTVKTKSGKWVNKGKEGTHGEFRTKKAADAQRKAMFAQGYKADESLDEAFDDIKNKKYFLLQAYPPKYEFKKNNVDVIACSNDAGKIQNYKESLISKESVDPKALKVVALKDAKHFFQKGITPRDLDEDESLKESVDEVKQIKNYLKKTFGQHSVSGFQTDAYFATWLEEASGFNWEKIAEVAYLSGYDVYKTSHGYFDDDDYLIVTKGVDPQIYLTDIDSSDEDKDWWKENINSMVKVESLKEDFKEVKIKTDETEMEMTSDENGKVIVTTEPVKNEEAAEETIKPLSDEEKGEIEVKAEENGEEEVESEEEIDDFDEESFDELGESYLKEVYDNVNSYKTTKVQMKNNKLFVEGNINFKSGKTKTTQFIFEGKKTNNKMRLIGENAQITKGKKSFKVSGSVVGKKFLSESFNYNYSTKDNQGKSIRLYNTIKRNK